MDQEALVAIARQHKKTSLEPWSGIVSYIGLNILDYNLD